MYTAQCTVYAIQCKYTYYNVCVRRTVYSVRRIVYSVRRIVYNVCLIAYAYAVNRICRTIYTYDTVEQCTSYTNALTFYILQCTLYSVQCTVYSIQCIVYSVQCILCKCVYVTHCIKVGVQRITYSKVAAYIVLGTLYVKRCTSYTDQRTMYGVQCSVRRVSYAVHRCTPFNTVPRTCLMYALRGRFNNL